MCVWDINKYSIAESGQSLNKQLLLTDENGMLHMYKMNDKSELKELENNQKQICQSGLTNISKIANNNNKIMITSLDCNFYFGEINENNNCNIYKILIGYNDEMLDINIK